MDSNVALKKGRSKGMLIFEYFYHPDIIVK